MSFFRPRVSKSEKSEERQLCEEKTAPFRASVHRPALTDEQVKKSMERLHDEMKSRRERTDEALINSMKFAKNHYSD